MALKAPPDPFQIVYADPPLQFKVHDRPTGLLKSPDRHYRTMKVSEVCRIPVENWVAKNALLVLWVYDPMIPAAFKIAEAFGFPTFITVLFRWFKTTNDQLRLFDPTPLPGFGTGYHSRGGACEEAWLFRRGRGLPVQRHDIRKEFFSPVREHSRKPDQVRGWITDLYGEKSRVELFARTTAAGWVVRGNEVHKFDGGQHG